MYELEQKTSLKVEVLGLR